MKRVTRMNIAITKCRKCGEEIELDVNDTEAILMTPYIKNSCHKCPKALSEDEYTLFDLVSIRKNPNYVENTDEDK
jgi:hypothetical protein